MIHKVAFCFQRQHIFKTQPAETDAPSAYIIKNLGHNNGDVDRRRGTV